LSVSNACFPAFRNSTQRNAIAAGAAIPQRPAALQRLAYFLRNETRRSVAPQHLVERNRSSD